MIPKVSLFALHIASMIAKSEPICFTYCSHTTNKSDYLRYILLAYYLIVNLFDLHIACMIPKVSLFALHVASMIAKSEPICFTY